VTPDTIIPGEQKDENGKIISSDTQGWNRLAYCRNNPIIYKDPTGHLPLTPFGPAGDLLVKAIDSVKSLFSGDSQKSSSKEQLGNKLQPAKDSNSKITAGNNKVVKPLDGVITSGYRDPRPNHNGIDIAGGKNIVAAKSGEVFDIRYQAGSYDKKGNPKAGAGQYIITKNDDKTYSYYMHTKKDSLNVHKGDKIAAGDKLAQVGHTGDETRPMKDHLHYEERLSPNSLVGIRPKEVMNLYKKEK
jgi:murein DD-endopeptidase MepM/ murein hydrolase activator NlpD